MPSPAQGELVPPWLKTLPLAPEFRPTAAEFADPIAYLLKIEPAAAPFGICKIVPPLPPPPKRTTLGNLSRSFAALHPGDPSPTFPTRHQELGLCPRRPRPALKPVWHSSRRYTLPQFEAEAGASRKTLLARLSVPASRHLSPLDVEALFWRFSADRPVAVEYASDMPGSGFPPCDGRPTQLPAANVGETAWNMRGVARIPASLLRFLREEVPGVTSPMLYVAMMFSWFAWHVEDHDLHSLNYLHSGAPKTWYGVPRDVALAFEDVVRVHGYGGEVNCLETFAMLGDKTTVMSPEVLVGSGIPCCRLVQNAGEFVVTFPGSYHSGFSHACEEVLYVAGFNYGEASNIATPQWLRVAKEAAVRRASINRPPMVSHYQLLYELALSMCLRYSSYVAFHFFFLNMLDPSSGAMEPRSSRLKEKKKCEGEQLVKKIFVQNVIEDNKLLNHFLSDGSSCIILPTSPNNGSALSTLLSKSQAAQSRILDGQCSNTEAPKDSGHLPMNGALSSKEISSSVCSGKKFQPTTCMHNCVNMSGSSDANDAESDKGDINTAAGLLDQGFLSCVTCGILSFSCVAVIKPRECAAKWLMSADSSLISKQFAGSGESHLVDALQNATSSGILRSDFQMNGNRIISDDAPLNRNSALDLLASAYGDPSDSDEGVLSKKNQVSNVSNELISHKIESQPNTSSNGGCAGTNVSSSSKELQQGPSSQRSQCIGNTNTGPKGVRTRNKYQLKMVLSEGFQPKDIYSEIQKKVQCELSSSIKTSVEPLCDADYQASRNTDAICMDGNRSTATMVDNLAASIVKPDKDSSRLHVFCLEHAIEVEKQLQTIGGAHIFLLCRPEYPKIEVEAKLLAEEMEVEYDWKDILFKEASIEDREKIQEVVQDEETIPTNSDWAVKLGINLYYSANLAKSPLYNKQLPYNRVIYKAFGCSSPNNSPVKLKTYARRQGRAKKIVLAGRWCGKVWMSNQVHPYLAHRIKSDEPDEIDGICSYQKSNVEHVENSSREATSRRKSGSAAIEEKTSKREKVPSEKANTKKPKHTEEDNSKALEGAAEASTGKSNGRTVVEKASKRKKEPVEKTNSKKPKHTEEDNSKALKGASEASSPLPSGMVIRSSSRIANRKNMLKLKMEEEDNGSVSLPKAKVEEDSDDPACRSRGRSLRQKTSIDVKKQTNKTRAEKRKAPNPAALKDEERTLDVKEFSVAKTKIEEKQQMKKTREIKGAPPSSPKRGEEYTCDIEGCSMSFDTKQELSLHKRDICPVKSCRRKFFSHKYLLQHRKVHNDDRPLKCSWKGCDMAFKWPWARTEHMRVHTGDRPYVCPELGCGQTFRFVSDFSRHKRRSGHAAKKAKTKK
ncbi:Lysine-specific demethylase JMJ705 [Dichanthelium oligosanthes]|uniref:Lysine-specific demethylase JMJ705 n=1 Tax=Dichanthelium oligosanthes TaxID=888268 RepID=A0A1E5W0W8_9POAL|nr:Lysine-specific demethylase JMJ705 [Dichanthelium oligosanthes]